MKPVLLVIDVQKEFFNISPETARSLKDAIEYINSAIDLFRKKDLPIICIQHMDEEEGLIPGADGFTLPDDLKIETEDLHIHRTYGNAFVKTGLAEKLTDLGVDMLIKT